jgi:hypothetical protein
VDKIVSATKVQNVNRVSFIARMCGLTDKS